VTTSGEVYAEWHLGSEGPHMMHVLFTLFGLFVVGLSAMLYRGDLYFLVFGWMLLWMASRQR
jgi:hypothetical protein